MSKKQLSVVVCGNYGHRTNQIDGQTIKTRVLKEAFADAIGEANVRAVDSSTFSRSPIRFLFEARRGFKECDQVFMLPGDHGIYVFLPLFLYWKRKWHRPLHYIVIGGWLPKLLGRNGWLRHLCAQLDGIYVQTLAMADVLFGLGLRNVSVLANFRKFDRNLKRNFTPTTTPIRLVFYSRVAREKGVEDAIAAVKQLNDRDLAHPRAILDVYGPIAERYRPDFRRCLGESQHVNYHGVLSPNNPYEVLQTYDLMLFPSYYYGEGFPGAVLDAYIAGVPVVASDWKYNREIVEEGRTGVLFKVHSVEEIVAHVETFIACPARIMQMRQFCLEKAQNYHVEQVIGKLLGVAPSE